jgi:SseB protein N-terminal domain
VSVLGGGESPFRDDGGSADPRVAAALAAFGAGLGSEHAALSALAGSRLLVPVVAVPSEPEARGGDWTEERGSLRPSDEGRRRLKGRRRRAREALSEPGCAGDHAEAGPGQAGGGDRGSEMSLPTLIGHDGRPAIPAFTCVEALARWDAQARPVPAQAGLVWRAAVDGSCAVVVDIAGPVPLAVDGARLAALAAGRPVPRPHQDPDVLSAVRAAVAGQPAIAGLRVAGGDPVTAGDDPAAAGGDPVTAGGDPAAAGGDPVTAGGDPAAAGGDPVTAGGDPAAAGHAAGGRAGEGCDLQIELTLAAGCSLAAGDEAARLLGRALMEQLGGRLRRGITIAVARPGGHPGP